MSRGAKETWHVHCDGCRQPIHAIPGDTAYSNGWVHSQTNSELCRRDRPGTTSNVARPPRNH